MYLVLQSPVKRIKATERSRVSFTKATKIADNDFHERYIFLTAVICGVMTSVRYHDVRGIFVTWTALSKMKGSPCCAGLMQSCLHTYRTKNNLTQHIIQPWGGGHQPSMGGVIPQVWGGHQPTMGGSSAKYGGVINQLWGGHLPSMGGHQPTMGGSSAKYGGVINQL